MVGLRGAGTAFVGFVLFLNYPCHFKSNHGNYQFLLNMAWVPTLRAHHWKTQESTWRLREHWTAAHFLCMGMALNTLHGIFKA